MKQTQPYAYLLEDIETGIKYIGCRFAKKCDPSDLGVSYFTSSSVVSKLFKSNPDRFSKLILMIGSIEEVIEFEKNMIDTSDAVMSGDYYNRTSGRAIHPDDRLAGALKEHSKRSPELYAEIISKMHSKTTYEQRLKAARVCIEKLGPEKLKEKMAMMRSRRTEEGLKRVAEASAVRAKENPKRMSDMGKLGGKVGGPKGSAVTNSQKWKCIQCGMVSLAGPLGKHLSRSGHVGKERVL